ncbi:hypothetical protein JB92DRAFT_3128586 [Gautieria morchelliformis]|nr:hypothetical protein JB92DRAFT_3128586 [Gautieria morchelliformis]
MQTTYTPPGPQPPTPMCSTTTQTHTAVSKTHKMATATQQHAPTTLTKTVNLTPSTREPTTRTNDATQWACETTPLQPRDSHIMKQDPHVHMTGQAMQMQMTAAEQRDPCDHANDDPHTHRLPHAAAHPPTALTVENDTLTPQTTAQTNDVERQTRETMKTKGKKAEEGETREKEGNGRE